MVAHLLLYSHVSVSRACRSAKPFSTFSFTAIQNVEKCFADLQALKTETWEEEDDEGLDEFLTRVDTESEACYNKVNEAWSNNLEIFDKCMTLLAPTKPHTLRQTQATAPNITSVF